MTATPHTYQLETQVDIAPWLGRTWAQRWATALGLLKSATADSAIEAVIARRVLDAPDDALA